MYRALKKSVIEDDQIEFYVGKYHFNRVRFDIDIVFFRNTLLLSYNYSVSKCFILLINWRLFDSVNVDGMRFFW